MRSQSHPASHLLQAVLCLVTMLGLHVSGPQMADAQFERRLITDADDGTAPLWELNTGESLAVMPQPGNRTARILVSPGEQYAVLYNSSSSYAGTHVWRLDPLEEIGVFGYLDPGPSGISDDSQHVLMWRVRDEEEGNLIGF
ncbi:MAG: hypothetical protein VX656_01270 [Candidatus Latescibacterota bacterium]|nr:hypothetical protein [Candidatus Latescibacterota bacterium]